MERGESDPTACGCPHQSGPGSGHRIGIGRDHVRGCSQVRRTLRLRRSEKPNRQSYCWEFREAYLFKQWRSDVRVPQSLRRVTDPLLERVPVPIVPGVNRGRWWNLSSAGSGFVSGRRAARQMKLLHALIAPADVVWDVGAHYGYMTLAAARRVGSAGQVQAFEPSSRNRRILARHLAWNRVGNATIHPYALSSSDGEASFGGGSTSRSHALGAGTERVQVRTAASLVRSSECQAPSFMKIDVEGAEGEVIEGATEILSPTARLLIAVHPSEADRKCSVLLAELGFGLRASRALQASRQGTWNGDPDLLCIGPEYRADEQMQEILRQAGFLPHG